MTNYDAAWVKAEEEKRAWLDANGLYKTEDEHSSCGVGLVVSISGKPSSKVVENRINALKAVWHSQLKIALDNGPATPSPKMEAGWS